MCTAGCYLVEDACGSGLVYKAGAMRRCRRFGIGLHFYTCVSSLLAL